MKEDFLYYLWKFQKFETKQLKTTQGETVVVSSVGSHNTQAAGPDFFNALVSIQGQKWAGTIEIHVKSSDWFVHQHQNDTNYDNVILHVVWEHDIEVFRSNNTSIPTLQLKDYVSVSALKKYKDLYANAGNKWINCENQIKEVPKFILENWLERIYFERLSDKSIPVNNLLKECKNNWEAVCFITLAKAFGGNSNGVAFSKIAHSIPFGVVQKATTSFELEALFFGQANLLISHQEDPYYISLKKEYEYLKHKFKLTQQAGLQVQFFKLRPSNFPTIRLSQLAAFYSSVKNVFSAIFNCNDIDAYEKLFDVAAAEYWKTHYTFGKISKKSSKKITRIFVELLLINAILPLKFAYENSLQKFDAISSHLALLRGLKPEKNRISQHYKEFGFPVENALDSQALLTLKKSYCDQHKCVNCAIGFHLLNASKP
ncbi:DUF2851 family protein [Aquimarina agarivorans]|uniref:DUF2851 family protein n=1 Tax=Aquimarina agarivorans TaxID=980584 RepID=UPI000248E652|nr:DUF2851 family protein [Aquimarina agarivorans]